VNIPNNVEEAVRALQELRPEAELRKFAVLSEFEALAGAHFGIGLFVRNQWLYPPGSPLAAQLRAELDLAYNEDSASDLVLRALWRTLRA
jgi:hypothetical protein